LATTAFAGGPIIIRGVVLDPEGNPLIGATVSVVVAEGSEIPRTTHSKKKGKFGIRVPDYDLAYNLKFELEGYVVATVRVQPNPGNMPPLTVTLAPVGQSPAQPAVEPPAETSETPPVEPPAEISEARIAAIPVFNEGFAALEAEDMPTALEKFRQASEIDPEFPEASQATAAVAIQLKDFAAAAEASENLVRLQPDNLDAIGTAYFAELMINDIDRLIPSARRLAEANPEVVANEMLQHARVLFDENELAGSKSLLEIIVEKEPELAAAYFQLGLTCNMLQDTACAVEALERFLELAPDDPEAATAQSLLDYLRQ
jgi:Tfp pilus assembly protein PilF